MHIGLVEFTLCESKILRFRFMEEFIRFYTDYILTSERFTLSSIDL
jgi:hypothetical protein